MTKNSTCNGDQSTQRTRTIDLGLAVLSTVEFRAKSEGKPLPQSVIAAACGCSAQYVSHVERGALRKLRARCAELGLELDELLGGQQNESTTRVL